MLGLSLDGLMLNPNCIIAKHIKSCNYYYYVRCRTLRVQVGAIPWPRSSATHYHAQLGLPDIGRVVVWLGSMIYGVVLWICARYVVWSLVVVRMAIDSSTLTPHKFIQILIK